MAFDWGKHDPKLKTLTNPKVTKDKKVVLTGRVAKVYYTFQPKENTGPVPPGTIEFAYLWSTPGTGTMQAFPFDEHFTNLPIVGEEIEVFNISKKIYYRRKNFTPNINGSESELSKNGSSDTYKPDTAHRLKLYEGDLIIQSRFGQSIRFSANNNDKKSISPTIIIRNRESDINKSESIEKTVVEDINRDGGTILLSSKKYISDFKPGVVDKNGKSNFELKVWENNEKYALESYPAKLDGDQIIISSDRLILSSKTQEMMFFSKGSQSLISDSIMTFDSNKGMNFVSQLGDIQFEANNRETKFYVGDKGKIFLGISANSPSYALANGKELVEAIGQLIDEIIKLGAGGILTPAGPSTGLNPVNQEALKGIMRKLPNVLSKKVFIGM